jgi:ABC-type Na+ efflux pump permease subunit
MRSEISFKSKKKIIVHDNPEKYFKSDFKTKKSTLTTLLSSEEEELDEEDRDEERWRFLLSLFLPILAGLDWLPFLLTPP